MSELDNLMEMFGLSRSEAEKKVAQWNQTEDPNPEDLLEEELSEGPVQKAPEPSPQRKPPVIQPSRVSSTSNEKPAGKAPIISTEDLYKQLRERPTDENVWGDLLWRGAVTLLVATTSAGKTILGHRLGRCLALGSAFLGMVPERLLRVLHIDMESPPGAKEIILEIILPVPGWDTTPIGISKQEAKALVRSREYDIIIVDNLQDVYPVKNEQDNAQAIEQMNYFTKAAKETDTSILVLYNTGKDDPESQRDVDYVHLARGASARVDESDLTINLVEKNGTCTMKVVKSRFGNKSETIKYKWAGEYDYELISHQRVVLGAQKAMEHAALEIMPFEPEEIKRAIVAEKLGVKPGTSEDKCLVRALKVLLGTGEARQPRHGHYQRIRKSEGS